VSLVKDTAFSAAASIVGTASRLLLTVILARALVPADYGRFVFIQWVIDLSFQLASLGITGSLVRFLPELVRGRGLGGSRGAFWLVAAAASSVGVGLTLFLVYLQFDPSRAVAPMALMAAWFLGAVVTQILFAAMQGLFRYDAVMAGNLGFGLCAPVLALLWLRTPSVSAAIASVTLAWTVAIVAALAVALLRKGSRRPPAASVPPPARQIVSYGLNLWILALLANLVWSRGEFGILRFHASDHDIAVYAAALSMTGAINQGCALLTGALTPHLARSWAAGEIARVETILRTTTSITLFCAAGLALLLTGFGLELAGTVLGHAYTTSYPVMCVLAVAAVSIASGSVNTLMQIITNGRFGLRINLVALVVLLGVSAALSPFVGIMGAAIARALAQMVTAIATFRKLRSVPSLRQVSHEALRALCAVLLVVGGFAAFVANVSLGLGSRLALAVLALGIAMVFLQRVLFPRPSGRWVTT